MMWYFGWDPRTEKGNLIKAEEIWKSMNFSLIIMSEVG